jgi:hypothetical protein
MNTAAGAVRIHVSEVQHIYLYHCPNNVSVVEILRLIVINLCLTEHVLCVRKITWYILSCVVFSGKSLLLHSFSNQGVIFEVLTHVSDLFMISICCLLGQLRKTVSDKGCYRGNLFSLFSYLVPHYVGRNKNIC